MNNNIGERSAAQRIWQYKLHYIIVLPALLLIFIFKLLPVLNNLLLSFLDYKPFMGMWGSEWVGIDNFKALFEQEMFVQAIINTLVVNSGYLLASGAVSLALALALGSIKSNAVRGLFTSLFLIPFFVPSIVIVGVVLMVLSPDYSPLFDLNTMLLVETEWIRAILIIVQLFQNVGIPVAIGLAAIMANQAVQPGAGNIGSNIRAAARAISAYLLLRLSVLLASNFELSANLVNGLNQDKGMMVDQYIISTGLMLGNYGLSAAAGTLQLLVQFGLTLAAYLLVRGRFLRDLFSGIPQNGGTPPQSGKNGWPGIAVSAVYAAVVLLFVYLLFIYPFTASGESAVSLFDVLSFWNLFQYGLITLISVVVFMLMTVTLAYPLTVKRLPGRGLYKLFLLSTLLVGSNMIGEYFLFRKHYMINTPLPQLILGFFALASVFTLKSIFNSKYGELKEQDEAGGRGETHAFFTLFLPKVWKPLLALGVLQFAAQWNSYFPSFLYQAREDSFSPVMRANRLLNMMSGELPPGDPVILQYCAIISLPPIVLFIIFRKWITSEVLTSQIRK